MEGNYRQKEKKMLTITWRGRHKEKRLRAVKSCFRLRGTCQQYVRELLIVTYVDLLLEKNIFKKSCTFLK